MDGKVPARPRCEAMHHISYPRAAGLRRAIGYAFLLQPLCQGGLLALQVIDQLTDALGILGATALSGKTRAL
jgi:hypothetical protein